MCDRSWHWNVVVVSSRRTSRCTWRLTPTRVKDSRIKSTSWNTSRRSSRSRPRAVVTSRSISSRPWTPRKTHCFSFQFHRTFLYLSDRLRLPFSWHMRYYVMTRVKCERLELHVIYRHVTVWWLPGDGSLVQIIIVTVWRVRHNVEDIILKLKT